MHDHDVKYYQFGSEKHGECNTHICRYLKGAGEISGHTWVRDMKRLLLDMLKQKEDDQAKGRVQMSENLLKTYSGHYDKILKEGQRECEKLSKKAGSEKKR